MAPRPRFQLHAGLVDGRLAARPGLHRDLRADSARETARVWPARQAGVNEVPRRRGIVTVAACIAGALLVVGACGGSSTPTSPTTPAPPSGSTDTRSLRQVG